MKAIRRFTVRPVLPEPLAAAQRSGPQSALVLARGDPRPLPVRRPRALGRRRTATPYGCSAACRPRGSPSWPRTAASCAGSTAVADDLHDYVTGDRWYQAQPGTGLPAAVAYFSPEFGITAALPQYSGGLGILAGDHLKAASDLGVPLIGVGLLYRHGYFRQSLSRDGWQQEHYPVLDPNELPVDPAARSPTAPRPGPPRPARRPARCAPGSGWPRSAGSRCCCSTPTSRRTTSANAG